MTITNFSSLCMNAFMPLISGNNMGYYGNGFPNIGMMFGSSMGYNYDAAAGFQTAMFLGDTITDAIQTNQQQKAKEKEERAEEIKSKEASIATLDGEIQELEAKLKKETDEKTKASLQEQIDDKKAERKRLQDEVANLKLAELGRPKVKMDKNTFSALFTQDGKLNAGQEVTSEAIEFARTTFQSATSSEEKLTAAKNFMTLWADYRYKNPSKTEQRVYNIIYEYLEKNKEATTDAK